MAKKKNAKKHNTKNKNIKNKNTNNKSTKNKEVINKVTKSNIAQKKSPKNDVVKENIFKRLWGAVSGFFKKAVFKTGSFFKRIGLCSVRFFQKIFRALKSLLSKMTVILEFIKKHKKAFGVFFFCLYTAIIVCTTLVVEHIALPLVLPASVESDDEQLVSETRVVMEKDNVYYVSQNCAIIYQGFEFSNTIKPANVEKTGEYFGQSYVNENEENTYLDVKFKYINKSSEPIRGDKAISMITTVGETSYEDIFTAIESNDGTNIDFSSSVEIASGENAIIHCIFDVPKETEKTEGIKSEVFVDGKSYIINVTPQMDKQGDGKLAK